MYRSFFLHPQTQSLRSVAAGVWYERYDHAIPPRKGRFVPLLFQWQTPVRLNGGNTNCDHMSLQNYEYRANPYSVPCTHIDMFCGSNHKMIREYLEYCSFSVFRPPLHISCKIISGLFDLMGTKESVQWESGSCWKYEVVYLWHFERCSRWWTENWSSLTTQNTKITLQHLEYSNRLNERWVVFCTAYSRWVFWKLHF